MDKLIGTKLRILRETLDLTPEETVRKIQDLYGEEQSISLSVYNSYESGHEHIPQETLEKIARALDIPYSCLSSGDTLALLPHLPDYLRIFVLDERCTPYIADAFIAFTKNEVTTRKGKSTRQSIGSLLT
jgi:transcriptional regulator with XRE-family HTH domain